MAALVIADHICLIEDAGILPRALSARPDFVRIFAAALVFLVSAGFAAAQDAPLKIAPLKVALYDVPPYGHVEPDGSIDG